MRCGHALGYLPDVRILSALEAEGEGEWRALAPQAAGRRYKMCLNYSQEQVCNWMLAAEDSATLCQACGLNQTIPDLSQPDNRRRWRRLEVEKRRLLYSLMALGLPRANKAEDPERGLAFAFLADPEAAPGEDSAVMTGHAEGLITVNIAEADPAERERRRVDMNEPYRTLLGHLRHESGHYYWERLVRPSAEVEAFRRLFGDERADYDQALRAYYDHGPPADWPARFVSAYASAHPWEDWAESWAHYLHIIDTLETARQFSLRVGTPEGAAGASIATPGGPTGDRPPSVEAVVASWLPLTYALNSLNRSMGQPDLYPFVLSPVAIQKLGFVHEVINRAAQPTSKESGSGSMPGVSRNAGAG